jgi:hypothetical protein
VCGPLGDPDPIADLAEAKPRLFRDAEQQLAVVGEECPSGCARHIMQTSKS